MSYPENPTPYIEYEPLPSGSTETPFLTHVTRGQRKNSRIFHTKENGLYFEYSVRYCFKNKFSVLCVYNGNKNWFACKSTFWMKPKNESDIIRIKGVDGKRDRFKLSPDAPMTFLDMK